ncbi:MAG: hypothetical protein IH859_05845 [Chloroflexi bacterium]|nr:hypothetical protein [Chloroflexota bacterium]
MIGAAQEAVVASRHWSIASARNARSVRREIKWRWTLNWLYRFPVIGPLLSDEGANGGGVGHSWFLKFLAAYASPEFNNTTGVLTVVYDWGWPLGLVLMGIYGILAGLTFASFKSGNGVLRYVYPIFLYSILELLRIGYIYDGRAVAAIIGIIIAIGFWRKAAAMAPPMTMAPGGLRPR